MIPASAFLDTGVIVAGINAKDAYHETARRFLLGVEERGRPLLYTSELVVAETLNFLRAKLRRREALDAANRMLFGGPENDPVVEPILRVHWSRFRRSIDAFHRVFDQGLSFTDCSTMIVIEDRGIEALATFDSGFRGLVPLVRMD